MNNTTLLPSLIQEHLIENLFLLAITQKPKSTKIFMQLLHDRVNTSEISSIVDLLDQNLPNVLLTECFNDDGLPFHIEVKNTEIGHLFEHVLLEYLCQLKIAKGSKSASFSGRTRWNWIKDPRGTFHIRLSCGRNDADILPLALEKTIKLMKIILGDEKSFAGDTLIIKDNGEATLTIQDLRKLPTSTNGLKNGEGKEGK